MKRDFLRALSIALVFAVTAPARRGLAEGSATPIELTVEGSARAALSQLLFPEQYAVSVGDTGGDPTAPGSRDRQTLPGLGLLQAEGAFDLLLVIDSGVSAGRASLARELVSRALAGRVSSVRVVQQPMLKVLPKEMVDEKRALASPVSSETQPRPEGRTRSDENSGTERGAQENPFRQSPTRASPSQGSETQPVEGTKAPQPTQAAPERSPTLFENLERNPTFAGAVLASLWSAAASLVAVALLVRRLARRESEPRTERPSHLPTGSMGASGLSGDSGASRESQAAAPSRLRNSKGHRDESILRTREEIVADVKVGSEKAARVLSQWVSASSDGARNAHVFCKNCDVSTLESVCALMHPSDVRIMNNVRMEGWDPFGDENALVLDRMKADLALLASVGTTAEKTAPLDFLRNLEAVHFAAMLEGESDRDIALVCSQLPIYRLDALFERLPAVRVAGVAASLSRLGGTDDAAFEGLARRLKTKKAEVESALVSDEHASASARSILEHAEGAKRQLEILDFLYRSDADAFLRLHKEIVTVHDVGNFPTKAVRALAQAIEPGVLGEALGDCGLNLQGFEASLSPGSRIVFRETADGTATREARAAALKQVMFTLSALREQGLVRETEIEAARERTRADLDRNARAA